MNILKKSSKKDFEKILKNVDKKFLELTVNYPKILVFSAFCLGYIAAVLSKIFFVVLFLGAIALLGFYLALPETSESEKGDTDDQLNNN